MKKVIVYVLLICCFQSLISCLPEQKDADETLYGIPPRQLSAEEIALKNDTPTCIITTGNGRVNVTMDESIAITPTPRGYFDFAVISVEAGEVKLSHNGGGGMNYNDNMNFWFVNVNKSGYQTYELKAGAYAAGLYYNYGNGHVNVQSKYMYKGYDYGDMTPKDGQKIYIKAVNDGSGDLDIIFCNFKMDWEYYYSSYTPITLNGKIRINR